MSYARFTSPETAALRGQEPSGVYVYLDSMGCLCCCACSIGDWTERFYKTSDLIKHLREHEAHGDAVPSDAIPSLEAEAVENDAWIKAVR